MLCKISCTFYKLAYFRSVGRIYIVEVVMQVLSKLKMKRMSYKAGKVISQIIRFIFKNKLRHAGVCENKENKKRRWPVKNILVEGWSIEGHVTKVVERIVMDFGLLILHKTKVLIM